MGSSLTRKTRKQTSTHSVDFCDSICCLGKSEPPKIRHLHTKPLIFQATHDLQKLLNQTSGSETYLRLTNSQKTKKINGWEMIFLFGMVYLQVRTVNFKGWYRP